MKSFQFLVYKLQPSRLILATTLKTKN